MPRGRAPPGLSNTPSSEDIKKAILGFPADGALQGASAAGAAGVPGAGGVAVPHDHAPHAPAAAEPGSWEDWKLYLEGLDDTVSTTNITQLACLWLCLAQLSQGHAGASLLKEQPPAPQLCLPSPPPLNVQRAYPTSFNRLLLMLRRPCRSCWTSRRCMASWTTR